MRQNTILLTLACFLTVDANCMLCESGVDGLKRPHFFADRYRTTCAKKMYEVFLLDSKSAQCNWEIIQSREICCGEKEPEPIPQAPTRPPASLIDHTGKFPICNVCWNDAFPGDPSMVINMLDLGVGSCKQFFEAGRAGFIVPHLCDTLQYFAYDPCGCYHGDSLGVGSKDDGIELRNSPPPTPLPTNKPTSIPTPYPTPSPTPNPTGRPTKCPTKSPTKSPSKSPTRSPTRMPTKYPTKRPTKSPTISPTRWPTESPTKSPTSPPTKLPTTSPTKRPTKSPTTSPTRKPTSTPTYSPSMQPRTVPASNILQHTASNVVLNKKRPSNLDGKDGIERWNNGQSRGGAGGFRFLKGSR